MRASDFATGPRPESTDRASGNPFKEGADRRPDGDRLRRLAAVGLMTPSVAHDINNMLQTLASVLHMIDRRSASGSADELANLTADGLQAIDRAAMFSKRLMTFVRPQAPMRSRICVNALLGELKPLLRWTLSPAIRLTMALADGPLETWCDPQDLENAVLNLAVNARDAMPDGGLLALQTFKAELDVDRPGLPRGGYVIITASDTGHGMAAEVMARAFDPFFTTKPAGDGFGMGLASVRAFANAAGGGADITSRPGQGAAVRLYLPQAAASL
jgi:signal transduction histidine kinase